MTALVRIACQFAGPLAENFRVGLAGAHVVGDCKNIKYCSIGKLPEHKH